MAYPSCKNLLLALVCALFSMQLSAADMYHYEIGGQITRKTSAFTSFDVGDWWTLELAVNQVENDGIPSDPDFQYYDLEAGGLLSVGDVLITYGTGTSSNVRLEPGKTLVPEIEFSFHIPYQLVDGALISTIRTIIGDPVNPNLQSTYFSDTVEYELHSTNSSVLIVGGPLTSHSFEGDIQFYHASEVPLPAAAYLFGSALIGLGIIKRKRAG